MRLPNSSARSAPTYRAAIAVADFRLSDARIVVAREYGFAQWTALEQRIEANALARALLAAIQADDRDAAATCMVLNQDLETGFDGDPQAALGQRPLVEAVELIAVTVALVDRRSAVDPLRERARRKLAFV